MITKIRLLQVIGMLLSVMMLVAACADDEAEVAPDVDEAEEPDEEDPEEPEADDTDDRPFEGEELTFVVPYSPGGGFDSQARGLAPTLEEKLGASGFAMENQPGAGGVLAINELMARGAPEGDTIAIANLSGILSSVLADDPVVEFDPAELGILGRIDAPPSAVVTATDGPYQTIEDIIEGDEEFLWGTAGPGSTAHLSALILGELLDFDYELAPGFEGTTEIETAIIRGEVDGLVVPLDSALPNIEAGDLHVLAFIHPEPVEEFEDVPLAVDLAEDPESQEVLEAHTNLLALLRPADVNTL
jgi:tripartite-type tricarboxylate transporter receptor subunit TctC